MPAPIRFLIRQVRARPLACFAAAFLLGMLLRGAMFAPAAACAIAAAALMCAGVALRKRPGALALLLVGAGLLGGVARMGVALDAITPVETRYSVEMTGRVDSEPFLNSSTGRLIFRFRLESAGDEPSDQRLRLYLRGEEADLRRVAYGQRLLVKGHIWKPDPVTNPYEFDFGAYLYRQGLSAYATAKLEDVQLLGQTSDAQGLVIRARQAVSRRIDALFPKSAGLMRALVLGDRSLLGDELRQALSQTGTAHLISISGMHVTVLAALLGFLLERFMSRKWANLCAAALLVPYGMLIGFTPSFVRALAMFAIFCFAPLTGRPSDPVTRLCAVLLAMLLARPLSLGDAGFILSFSASAGILLLMPPLSRMAGIEALRRRQVHSSRLKRLTRLLAAYLLGLLCASLAAQLTTLPAVIALFGVQSLVSLPFNLVCVPLCLLGYLTGLAALAVSLIFMPLAALLAKVPDALFDWLVAVARLGERIPVSGVRIGRYPALLVAAHWLLVLAASDLSRIPFRARRLMPLALVAVAGLSSLLIFAAAWPFSVTFLDAGQADCAVVRTRGHTYMLDTGDTYTPAADYLNATCLGLDGVFLSHPHQDHAGGLSSVLDSFRPGVIYVPKGWFEVEEVAPAVVEGIEKARGLGVQIREVAAGDSVRLSDTATLEVFAPAGDALPAEVNDLSMLALVSCEGTTALFTGDLSAQAEPEVIPDIDLLKVAHHGSAKATSERFLEAATPEISVISVGENNYGHPAPETVEKLDKQGGTVYRTLDCGAITAVWRNGRWHVETYLEATDEVE